MLSPVIQPVTAQRFPKKIFLHGLYKGTQMALQLPLNFAVDLRFIPPMNHHIWPFHSYDAWLDGLSPENGNFGEFVNFHSSAGHLVRDILLPGVTTTPIQFPESMAKGSSKEWNKNQPDSMHITGAIAIWSFQGQQVREHTIQAVNGLTTKITGTRKLLEMIGSPIP